LAVLAGDSSEVAAIVARVPGAIAQRMQQDALVTELPHMLYGGDTPLHLAAAALRYDVARALLASGAPVDAVNRRGATVLHYACDSRPSSATWDPTAQRRIIELLVSRGAAVYPPGRGRGTALPPAGPRPRPAAGSALPAPRAAPPPPPQKGGPTPVPPAVPPP